jgi:hypothetical protein
VSGKLSGYQSQLEGEKSLEIEMMLRRHSRKCTRRSFLTLVFQLGIMLEVKVGWEGKKERKK